LLIAGRCVRVNGEDWSEDEDADAPDERAMDGITIRHCTLVPGWLPGALMDESCEPLFGERYSLELLDTVARVIIDHSSVGSIRVEQNEVLTDPILLRVSDSIIDATNREVEALDGPYSRPAHAVLSIARSTVIGTIYTHAFDVAENTIFNGRL